MIFYSWHNNIFKVNSSFRSISYYRKFIMSFMKYPAIFIIDKELKSS